MLSLANVLEKKSLETKNCETRTLLLQLNPPRKYKYGPHLTHDRKSQVESQDVTSHQEGVSTSWPTQCQ